MSLTILQRLERAEHQLILHTLGMAKRTKSAGKTVLRYIPDLPAVSDKLESRQGQAWSEQDDDLLWSWRDVGKSYEDIAEVLGRTTRACQCRWSILNCGV